MKKEETQNKLNGLRADLINAPKSSKDYKKKVKKEIKELEKQLQS